MSGDDLRLDRRLRVELLLGLCGLDRLYGAGGPGILQRQATIPVGAAAPGKNQRHQNH